MHLIDSHCHIDFEQFDHDRDDVLEHCHQLGIQQIIVPGVKANSWDKLIDICQQSTMLYPVFGLHPMFMDDHLPEYISELTKAVKEHNPIAIGEIGLDFYLPNHDKETQIKLFRDQLLIAQSNNLPVILHVRKAHDRVINLLKQFSIRGGIVHAFSGSLQQAKQYQDLGFLLGVSGAMTHSRATRLRTMVSQLPLSSIALETDAPDMPLSGLQQQQRNTPENIPEILKALVQIRTESEEEIATATTHNCRQLFRI